MKKPTSWAPPGQEAPLSSDNEYELVFARIEAVCERAAEKVLHELEAAGSLCDELIAAPMRTWSELVRESRFLTISVANRLLLSAARERTTNPSKAAALAAVTFDLCNRLPGDSAAAGLVAEVRLGALCQLAAARLDLGDRVAAHEALRCAARHLGGSVFDCERAHYALTLGRLRAMQGRIDEALALLDRAATLFAVLGQQEEQGAALTEKGCLLLDAAETQAAELELKRAMQLLGRSTSSRAHLLLQKASHGVIVCRAELRGPELAAELLRRWANKPGSRPNGRPPKK